jgi:hypothetical protein
MFYSAFLLMNALSSRGSAVARTVEGPRWPIPSKPRFLIFVGVAPLKVTLPIIAVALTITAVACGKRRLEPEVYIPSGMPVTIDVSRDDPDPETIKYIISPQFDPDIEVVSVWLYKVNSSGKIYSASAQIKFLDIDKRAETGNYSWNKTDDVSRFLVIVFTVKTHEGIWAPDITDVRQFPINEVMNKGAAALPKAKFIRDDE